MAQNNNLHVPQMEILEKYNKIERMFFDDSLFNLSLKIDDFYAELSEDKREHFLKWMELEFIANRLIIYERQMSGLHKFDDPTIAADAVNKQKQKIDYLQGWVKENKKQNLKIKSEKSSHNSIKESSYLGQSTNDKANDFFEFLIQYYRPEEKTKVKYVNILYYLKNDANKEFYIFKVKQEDYVKIVKSKVDIVILKFQKSEKYDDVEKHILNSLEVTFRQQKG